MAQPWFNLLDLTGTKLPRDGSADVSGAINKAIQEVIHLFYPPDMGVDSVRFGALYFPPGVYRLDGPLLLARRLREVSDLPCKRDPMEPLDADRIPFKFCHIELVGDTPGPASDVTGESHATILRASFSDRPAILIQGGQSIRIRNLVIEGTGAWASRRDPRSMLTHDDESSYGFTATQLGRNTPYAGICIDPFSHFLEGTNRYAGQGIDVAFYDNSFLCVRDTGGGERRLMVTSSDIEISDCLIRGFAVGVAVSPSGVLDVGAGLQPANAENIRLSRCTLESTHSAVAICQNQSRLMLLEDVTLLGAKFAINCVDYGLGAGNMPSIFGGKAAGIKFLFHANSQGSGYAIAGLHAEDILALGQLHGSSDHDGFVFDGCHFRFGWAPQDRPAVNAHLFNLTHTIFHGCTFERLPWDQDVIALLSLQNTGTLTFVGCRFHGNLKGGRAPIWISDGLNRAVFRDCLLSSHVPSTDEGGSPYTVLLTPLSAMQQSTVPAPALPGSFHLLSPAEGLFWVSGVLPQVPLGTGVLSVVPDKGEASFTIERTPDVNGQDPVFDHLEEVVQDGDLVLSNEEQEDVGFRQANGTQVSGKIVLGVISGTVRVEMGRKTVTMNRVARGVRSAASIALHVSYLPKVHPRTQVNLVGREAVILDPFLVNAWQRGDRVNSAGLLHGTHIIDKTGNKLTLSTWALKDGPAEIFGADIRRVVLRDP